MSTHNYNDLFAFRAVAEAKSFTRAAAHLGVSQSALSHTIRGLETQLGIRLLARTTRSVAPTEAGERLLATLAPKLDEIEQALASLSVLSDRPSGHIRITASEHSAQAVLWPKLEKFLPTYPEISVEVTVDYGFTDIVAERYDAGVRIGDHVEKDMVAVRIAPDMRMAVVGSPAYFLRYPTPNTPEDLTAHSCINIRMPTHGGLYVWEFERKNRAVNVRVQGQLIFNTGTLRLKAALAGLGLAYVPHEQVRAELASEQLISVLDDWCAPFSGYHLYYPSRRHLTPAFKLLVEALRWRP